MKYLRKTLIIILILSMLLPSCTSQNQNGEITEDTTTWLNMNTSYPSPTSLEDGGGRRARVIILIGQSNATGCSLNSYLEKNVPAEDFARYSAGFDSVLINYCLDDQKYTSAGEFRKVDLTASADDCFGPELGMAEVLSEAYPDETVFILKYTMSGYSLHHHWLCGGERGSIYEAFISFARTYLAKLTESNYDARVGAICWMQGESDTTDFKASHYLANQTAFASYLREDLAGYAEDGGIYFIDAGISNSPYCEPAYPEINEAKLAFSKLSPLNLYFSTIDAGYTVSLEPEGDPDWGHYDSLSELALGRKFGELIIGAYSAE